MANRFLILNEGAAAQYLNFLNQVGLVERRRVVERSIIEDTGRAMAEIGVGDGDSWLVGGVAAEIASFVHAGEGGPR